MKLENIEIARQLIYKRSVLQNVVEKSEQWGSGHFEFTEDCGSHPERISITNFPVLKMKILNAIKDEIENIENELTKM